MLGRPWVIRSVFVGVGLADVREFSAGLHGADEGHARFDGGHGDGRGVQANAVHRVPSLERRAGHPHRGGADHSGQLTDRLVGDEADLFLVPHRAAALRGRLGDPDRKEARWFAGGPPLVSRYSPRR